MAPNTMQLDICRNKTKYQKHPITPLPQSRSAKCHYCANLLPARPDLSFLCLCFLVVSENFYLDLGKNRMHFLL